MKDKNLIRRLIALGVVFLIVFFCSYGLSYSSTLKKLRAQDANDPSTHEEPQTQQGQEETTTQTAESSPLNPVPVGGKNAYSFPPSPVPDSHVIYLTFDDGPCENTSRLLDILKKYNVKATFFCTAMYPEYLDIITREANEGHSVAVHTYSHVYSRLYASVDAFWSDFNKMQSVIQEKTGSTTLLCRFPGGSSNTISRKYNSGIMTTLAGQMEQKGYVYFDWNVDSNDAGTAKSKEQVLQNCKDGVSEMHKSVLLCHDLKAYTVSAMDEFIPWALENGYVFLPLSTDSFNAHHGILN